MPHKSPHGCRALGCSTLIRKGSYCDAHARPSATDRERGTHSERGYTAEWSRAAKRHLEKEPLCRIHLARGEVVPATEVDHILPVRTHPELFWVEDNWQSTCHSCHSSKTRAETEARRNGVAM